MSSTADRNNGRMLKNYIYAKLFSLNCPRYGAQINAFIDILDVKYYWYILYPIIKELNSEVLSEYDEHLYNDIKNSLL